MPHRRNALFDASLDFDDVLDAVRDKSPPIKPEPKSASKPDDRREDPRKRIKLRVSIVYHTHRGENRPTYHGWTHDVSISGLSVLVATNIFTEDDVTILVAVRCSRTRKQTIVEAVARMHYTVLSAEHDMFRVGLAFRSFKGSGKRVLQELLAERPY